MVHPNTTKHRVTHFYPLRAPVKDVDDNLEYSPAGLGFRRRGAPELRDGTKGYGVSYHVYTSVIRVSYAQPFTHSLCWVLTGIGFPLPGSHALIG